MARKEMPNDWFWPLGLLDYTHEVLDLFPDEAASIGVIAIMWNRQELALRRAFAEIMGDKVKAYAEAIWDRQPTHQARRDLLALALTTADLSDRQRSILEWILEKTKTVADRRNELMHAEYVVHGRTDVLHAKVRSPRSTKPAKHQKLSVKDLNKVVQDLNHLLQATEGAWIEFMEPEKRERLERLGDKIREVAEANGIVPTDPTPVVD